MKRTLALFATATSLAVATIGAHAQTATTVPATTASERLKSMSPEERAAAKEKAKARWDSMSPEEQEAAKKRFAEKRPRLAERMAKKQGSAASSPK